MSGSPTAHKNFTRCQDCGCSLNASSAAGTVSSHSSGSFLVCGHVLCNQCTRKYAGIHGLVFCRFCKRAFGKCLLPPPLAIELSPVMIMNNRYTTFCDYHHQTTTIKCSCDQRICLECTLDSHADHFNYVDLHKAEIDVDELEHLRGILLRKRDELANKKQETDSRIQITNRDIAAKFTRIIAQAITRCLDLMAQATIVGKMHCAEYDKNIMKIDRALSMIDTTKKLRGRSHHIANLSVRSRLNQAASSFTLKVQRECDQLRAVVIPDMAPMLMLSHSPSTINHIANIGKIIVTNLIDGNRQEVATIPTPLIPKTQVVSYWTNAGNFNRALQQLHICMSNTVKLMNTATPPSLYLSYYVTEVQEAVDNKARFLLKRIGTAANAAASAADAATANSSAAGSGRVVDSGMNKLPINEGGEVSREVNSTGQSVASSSKVKAAAAAAAAAIDFLSDPGPSSPKRIKVEEEGETDGSNLMENLLNFAEDCEKAVNYEEEMATFMSDEVKIEDDEDE